MTNTLSWRGMGERKKGAHRIFSLEDLKKLSMVSVCLSVWGASLLACMPCYTRYLAHYTRGIPWKMLYNKKRHTSVGILNAFSRFSVKSSCFCCCQHCRKRYAKGSMKTYKHHIYGFVWFSLRRVRHFHWLENIFHQLKELPSTIFNWISV